MEEFNMTNITELELQNLRHLLLAAETDYGKFSTYANQASDPYVKQFFQKSVQSATKNQQQLMQFLQ
jgi:spore coat protein CotF